MTIGVSIILATYNRAHLILETLASIQNQTYTNWECLIIDDGGTDTTFEILQPLLSSDSRFSYQKRPSSYLKGLPGCRNFGLDLAKGDYIIFFDDDDIVHPKNLEICVKELENQKYYFCRYLRTVFNGDFNYIFDNQIFFDSFIIDSSDIEAMLKNELPFNSCAVMWRKSCFLSNRFVEHLMYAEEWELYSRILSSGITGISINKILFYGRKHLNSNTGEFYSNNPIRKKSHSNAALLIVKNLKEKNLLTNKILRYFVQLSFDYKEYNLFRKILELVNLTIFEKLKWQIFYTFLPLRLYLYKLKKNMIS